MRLIFLYEKKQIEAFLKEMATEFKYKDIPLKTALINYMGNAILVILSAIFLPKIGEGLAATTGLGQTFVGNIFIAISTSLPEVVVSIAAVRMGSVDLAIGNLFGSNIFNIFILALDDIFFTRGPILSFRKPKPYDIRDVSHCHGDHSSDWSDLSCREKAFIYGMGFYFDLTDLSDEPYAPLYDEIVRR